MKHIKNIFEIAQARQFNNRYKNLSKNEQLKIFINLLEKVCEKLNLPMNESFDLSKEIDKRRIANYLTQGMSFKLLDNLNNQNFENVIEKLSPMLYNLYQKYFSTLLNTYREYTDEQVKSIINIYINSIKDEKLFPKNFKHKLNIPSNIETDTLELSDGSTFNMSIINDIKKLEHEKFTPNELSELCKEVLLEIFNPKEGNSIFKLTDELTFDIKIDYSLPTIKQGQCKVTQEPPTVIARGSSFIIALHEAIKGTCEYFASSDKGYTKEELSEIYDITENQFEEFRGFKYGYTMVEKFLYYFSTVEEYLMFTTNPKTNSPYIKDNDFSMSLLFLEYVLTPSYISTDKFLDMFNTIFEGEDNAKYEEYVKFGSNIYIRIMQSFETNKPSGNAPPPDMNENYIKKFNNFINKI